MPQANVSQVCIKHYFLIVNVFCLFERLMAFKSSFEWKQLLVLQHISWKNICYFFSLFSKNKKAHMRHTDSSTTSPATVVFKFKLIRAVTRSRLGLKGPGLTYGLQYIGTKLEFVQA
jgi:hypothetical protein